ncbi:insulinase family protein [Pseudohaliea rubra]|uniref:Protease 3 n=1 Tax=Pseudohaliea rubra DSM 19751 TaxID=1265313 RepID=A0A095VUK6_9GAMM|nr:insulinase family protein [Pseudohaliea rubra]KGE04758.1 Protease III precursor [Pseudohaliea rubra DSM 19751]
MPLRSAPPLPALLVLLFSALLAACAASPVREYTEPAKSEADDYAYRLLTLENGLQALLISDPDTRKAAASLDVMVGSGDNPPGRGGLAHFLEHMLFLGTDKYPDAAEYERYITEHGGSRNAYTSFEHTNYFFDINASYLEEGLDRFAQFFIAPRLDADYVDREKNAVQAEYQMGLKSDPRRGLDVLQAVMNPAHPYSQFSVGSLETLADRPGAPVREDLLAFYRKHYSANAMRLVVLGAEPLEELEKLVAPLFARVPNHDYEPEPMAEPLFEPASLPMKVTVQPQATLRQLQVNFQVPDYRSRYRAKPMAYLGNLIGHEGEGSLLLALKREGLAEGLSAGEGLSWRGGSLFSVTVSLTERGVAEHERVLRLLFSYLAMLREEGPQRWLYEEQSELAAIDFRFREHGEPMGYVSALAGGMHYYAPRDVLQGPYLMERFAPELIEEALDRLRPALAQVVLTAPGVPVDRESPHYEVPFGVTTAPALASRWAPTDVASLHLPAPNAFIAEDLSLVPLAADNPETPTIALDTPRTRIWFRQGKDFRTPRGALYVNFRSPLVSGDARAVAAAMLYTRLLTDAVNSFTYPARLAGLDFSLYKHARGVSLRISGYNDKQQVLLEQLLDTVQAPAFDRSRFESLRADLVRGLENAVAKRPVSQVIDDLREALLYGAYGEAALIEALRGLDLAAIEDYADAFWAGVSAEALLYGNYPQSAVAELAAALADLLPAGDVPALPPLEVLRIGAGESLQFVTDVPHDDAVVSWYLQGAGDSWRDRAATALAAQVMKSGFFQELRTEQQLGYVVSAFSWPQFDIPGLVLLVQSPSHDAGHVAGAMEEFLDEVLPSLDNSRFQRHREALVAEIEEPDKNLFERAEFYWQSIAKRQYAFDGRRQLAAAVNDFDRDEWAAYFREVFREQPRSLQVVAPGARGVIPDNIGRRVTNATAIKADHDTWSVDQY